MKSFYLFCYQNYGFQLSEQHIMHEKRNGSFPTSSKEYVFKNKKKFSIIFVLPALSSNYQDFVCFSA